MNVHDRVLNACFRLNSEAYEVQVLTSKHKLKQFTPCNKAEVLMEVVRNNKHLGTARIEAILTPCICHSTLTESQLLDYEYDDTFKLAHYNHDSKTLYPRLYK